MKSNFVNYLVEVAVAELAQIPSAWGGLAT